MHQQAHAIDAGNRTQAQADRTHPAIGRGRHIAHDRCVKIHAWRQCRVAALGIEAEQIDAALQALDQIGQSRQQPLTVLDRLNAVHQFRACTQQCVVLDTAIALGVGGARQYLHPVQLEKVDDGIRRPCLDQGPQRPAGAGETTVVSFGAQGGIGGDTGRVTHALEPFVDQRVGGGQGATHGLERGIGRSRQLLCDGLDAAQPGGLAGGIRFDAGAGSGHRLCQATGRMFGRDQHGIALDSELEQRQAKVSERRAQAGGQRGIDRPAVEQALDGEDRRRASGRQQRGQLAAAELGAARPAMLVDPLEDHAHQVRRYRLVGALASAFGQQRLVKRRDRTAGRCRTRHPVPVDLRGARRGGATGNSGGGEPIEEAAIEAAQHVRQLVGIVAEQLEAQIGIQIRRLGQSPQPPAGSFGPDRTLFRRRVALSEQLHHAGVHAGQVIFATLARTPCHVVEDDREFQIFLMDQTDSRGGETAHCLETLAVLQTGEFVEGGTGFVGESGENFGTHEAAIAGECLERIEKVSPAAREQLGVVGFVGRVQCSNSRDIKALWADADVISRSLQDPMMASRRRAVRMVLDAWEEIGCTR